MSHDLLEVTVVAKEFQELSIIRDVRFGIDAGEVVSLVGPSGCGKSSLLRIIAGLDRNYSGGVQLGGRRPHLPSRDIGLVFREPRLLPWLTVAENVALELGRTARHDSRVTELLAEVGLRDFATAYPKQLSSGMAQRAAIARSLFHQPTLLLLDEPFSGVDATTRRQLQDLLLSVTGHRRTTVLLVTQDTNEAVYLSDRVIVLAPGPGRISGQAFVDARRPRDRRNPELAKCEAEVLTLLIDGTSNFFDLSYDLARAPRRWQAARLSSFNFAI